MKITVFPADDTIWKGAKYTFTVELNGNDYPHVPPAVKLEERIYHPNIDLTGNVCLNILRDGWKPIYGIKVLMFGLNHLFN
mmetsp:Transcript_117014/g.164467  ORF Transcript_117014/g.164467 Transcript_117014/m.164467 type:complete len:81 (-) Transcript_117014:140-382(-)